MSANVFVSAYGEVADFSDNESSGSITFEEFLD